jgi:hypothetical protein
MAGGEDGAGGVSVGVGMGMDGGIGCLRVEGCVAGVED